MKTIDKIVYIILNLLTGFIPYFITVIVKRCNEKIKEE